jgi:PAS domain S-box-containing protein
MLGTHTDITERKKAEENLVATLKRTQDQQAALNTISFSPLLFSGDVHGLSARLTELSSQVFGVERASVWLFNSKGDELRCTDLYEVMYDRHTYDCVLKRSEYVNEFEALSTAKFIDAHDPLTDPRTAGYVKSYLKPNRITSMLDAVIRVSGQNLGVLCFEHVDRSHHWENDEITFACQLADQIAITLLNRDRKRVEEALRESEEKYRTVADFTYDWEYWRTPDGKYVYVSPSCERITGYRSEEFILDPNLLNSIVHSDDRNHFLDHLSHPESEVCDKNPLEFRIISRSGEERWIGNRGQSVYGHDGKYLGRRGSNRDITQRKLAEEALKVSEEKYRNLFMAGADGIVVHDAQGRNIDANAQACEMLGYSHSELLAMRVSDLIPKEDLKQKPPRLTEVMAGQTVCYERKLQRKDGTLLDLEIRASQVAENTVQAFWRDITERKIAEEALYQANKKLNLLTSITRHDINNQLTVLMGYLTILKRKQPDPVLNEYFVKVDTAAQRISSMIQFTKQYESIGVKAPAWQNCRTVADTATKDAQLGKVMIKNDLPTSAEVFADPLVVKVFYNLIDNAVRYGGKITTIRFSVEEAGEEHIIVCEDDGDGVVAEEKEKIFERGFGKNTGLGLALAREILDITGITIKECGEPGTGARFEMAVPKGAWRIGNSDENKK